MKRAWSILISCLVSGSPALAFERGDWVLARYSGGRFFYPGIVQGVAGKNVQVRYDMGEVETRPDIQVKVFNWRVGTRIECNWRDVGWFSGRINALERGNLSIAYDDGDREDTRTSRCRSL